MRNLIIVSYIHDDDYILEIEQKQETTRKKIVNGECWARENGVYKCYEELNLTEGDYWHHFRRKIAVRLSKRANDYLQACPVLLLHVEFENIKVWISQALFELIKLIMVNWAVSYFIMTCVQMKYPPKQM